MNTNERYEFHRSQGLNQTKAFALAVADVIEWAQANGHATNKPNTKAK